MTFDTHDIVTDIVMCHTRNLTKTICKEKLKLCKKNIKKRSRSDTCNLRFNSNIIKWNITQNNIKGQVAGV